jgi:hypothetical protein
MKAITNASILAPLLATLPTGDDMMRYNASV